MSGDFETQYTNRGFAFIEFEDANGVQCTLQKSSMATEEAIWLGAREIGLKQFIPYQGWKDVPTPSGPHGTSYVANNRMHLTREQLAHLLPVLTSFVETGEVSPTGTARTLTNGGENGR